MSAKSRTAPSEIRIFMVLHIKVYEQFLVNEGSRKISVRFREAIENLRVSENLKNDLRNFYRRHSAFFTKELSESKGKKIQLHAPPELPEFLNSLLFFVLGSGNASLISRIIMYHLAVQNKWLPAPPVGATTKKEAAGLRVPVTGKRIPVTPLPDKRNNRKNEAYVIDTLFSAYKITKADLKTLSVLTQRKGAATLRYLIDQAAIGDTPNKIKAFYKRKWRIEEGLQKDKLERVRYRIPRSVDKILNRLEDQIIETPNRSLLLRTIIAYSAELYGVRPR
jgi:hypothetical protein